MLRRSPITSKTGQGSGLTDHIWTVGEIVALLDLSNGAVTD